MWEPNAASGHILESREGVREAGRHRRQEKPEQESLLCLVVPNNVIGKGAKQGFSTTLFDREHPREGTMISMPPFSLCRRRRGLCNCGKHALPIGQQRFLMKKGFRERLEKK